MKNNRLIIIIMTTVIVILAILCFLFATDKVVLGSKTIDKVQNSNSNDSGKANDQIVTEEANKVESKENISRSAIDIMGTYSTLFSNLNTSDEVKEGRLTLSLYDNGIFTYDFEQYEYAPFGTIGNYIVIDNKIILTTWFNTNSGTGLRAARGTKTLTINDDGTITDDSIKLQILIDSKLSEITLTKNDEEVKSFDINNRIDAACLNGTCNVASTNAAI